MVQTRSKCLGAATPTFEKTHCFVSVVHIPIFFHETELGGCPVSMQVLEDHKVPPLVLVSEDSIRGWLPGTRNSELSLKVPARVSKGRYQLAFGVVDPNSQVPVVRLAIEGRDAEGWYPLSRVEAVN